MSNADTTIDVQGRFAEVYDDSLQKINIANPNRFLLREDNIFVMFTNRRKTRKMFLFNDLLILCRKDWRGKPSLNADKNHVIEKIPLKDIRVFDIVDNSKCNSCLHSYNLNIAR
jgi:phosphatidylserine/phosphatidylglycerophosphate/cardiolipin synthase-like enzyme